MPTCLSDEEVHELNETARESGDELANRALAERKSLLMVAVTAAGVRNQVDVVVKHYASTLDSVVLAVLLRKMNDYDRALAAWNPVIAKQLGSLARAAAEAEQDVHRAQQKALESADEFVTMLNSRRTP